MMNRRLFVQRLSAAALATKSMRAMAEMFETGHRYRHAPLVQESVERARRGEIGEVTHVFGYSYGDSFLREPLAPALHHVDVANLIFGAAPQSVFAGNGREGDRSVQAMFTYSGGRRLVFRSMSSERKGDQLWVYGSKGSLSMTLHVRPGMAVAGDPSHARLIATMAVTAAKQSLRDCRELDIADAG